MPGSPVTPGLRLLIAEDDPNLLRLLAEEFGRQGYAVTATTDGTEALNTVRDGHDIDLAVIDMLLPGASGFRVLEGVKRSVRAKALMISGAGADEFQAYAAALGADGFLVKPFTIDELVAAVEELRRGFV